MDSREAMYLSVGIQIDDTVSGQSGEYRFVLGSPAVAEVGYEEVDFPLVVSGGDEEGD